MPPELFMRIADELRGRIQSGDLPPGARLPAQTDLMRKWRTTTVTVRRALDELTREGLITANRPVGTFVRDPTRHQLPAADEPRIEERVSAADDPPFPNLADRLLAQIAGPDRPITQRLDHVVITAPPAGIATRLQLDGGDAVFRRRIAYVGDDKVLMRNDYYPAALVDGSDLLRPSLLITEGGTIPVLTDLGFEPKRLRDEFFVRYATSEECKVMGWPVGSPVFVQMTTASTASDVPVACWTSVLPADNWIFTAERERAVDPRIRAVS